MFRCLERSLQIVFELESPPSAKGYAKVSNISRATSMLKPLVLKHVQYTGLSQKVYMALCRGQLPRVALCRRHGRSAMGVALTALSRVTSSSVRGAGHVVTGFYILVRATVTVRSRWSRGCLEVA